MSNALAILLTITGRRWASKFWVDRGGAFDTAAEAWEDICRAYPAAEEDSGSES